MAIDVSQIKDAELRNTLWRLGQEIEATVNNPKRQPQPKQPRDRNAWLLDNGTPKQAQESAELARKRYGD